MENIEPSDSRRPNLGDITQKKLKKEGNREGFPTQILQDVQENEICQLYLKGACKDGNFCKKIHLMTQVSQDRSESTQATQKKPDSQTRLLSYGSSAITLTRPSHSSQSFAQNLQTKGTSQGTRTAPNLSYNQSNLPPLVSSVSTQSSHPFSFLSNAPATQLGSSYLQSSQNLLVSRFSQYPNTPSIFSNPLPQSSIINLPKTNLEKNYKLGEDWLKDVELYHKHPLKNIIELYSDTSHKDFCYVLNENTLCISPKDDEVQEFYEQDVSSHSGGSAYNGFIKEAYIRNHLLEHEEMTLLPRLFVELNYFETLELDGVFLGKSVSVPPPYFKLRDQSGNFISKIPHPEFEDDFRFFFIETKSFCIPSNPSRKDPLKQKEKNKLPRSDDFFENHNIPCIMKKLLDKVPRVLTFSRGVAKTIYENEIKKITIILFYNGRDDVDIREEVRFFFEKYPVYQSYQDCFYPVWYEGNATVCSLLKENSELKAALEERDKELVKLEQRIQQLEGGQELFKLNS